MHFSFLVVTSDSPGHVTSLYNNDKIDDVPIIRDIITDFQENYIKLEFFVSGVFDGETFERLAVGSMKELLGADVTGHYL